MKKLIANFCMWVLGKLGYSNQYYQKNTIVIEADVSQAVKALQRLQAATQKYKDELAGINPITPTI